MGTPGFIKLAAHAEISFFTPLLSYPHRLSKTEALKDQKHYAFKE